MNFIGKTVLAGLTFLNSDGSLNHREQVVGTICEIQQERIILRKADGNEYGLPPALSLLKPAQAGVYRLKNGNIESVTNPDFLIEFDIHLNPDEKTPITNPNGYVPHQDCINIAS